MRKNLIPELRTGKLLHFYRTLIRSLATTHSLTDCRLVNLIDVTLACEDANSKLVEAFIVADVDDKDRVGNSLLQIQELRFKADVWSIFCPCLVEVTKLNLGEDSEAKISQDFEFKLSRDTVVCWRVWS